MKKEVSSGAEKAEQLTRKNNNSTKTKNSRPANAKASKNTKSKTVKNGTK